jgi:hypothetical protein
MAASLRQRGLVPKLFKEILNRHRSAFRACCAS